LAQLNYILLSISFLRPCHYSFLPIIDKHNPFSCTTMPPKSLKALKKGRMGLRQATQAAHTED
jgi:hypothetical protein